MLANDHDYEYLENEPLGIPKAYKGNALSKPIILYNGPNGILPILLQEYYIRASIPVQADRKSVV